MATANPTITDNGRVYAGPAATEYLDRHAAKINGRTPRAVTGAGRRMKLDDRREIERHRDRRVAAWQDEACEYYDAIGEIKYAYWYFGNCLARIRLYIATQADPMSPPVDVTDPDAGIAGPLADAADASLARLGNSDTGIPGLMYEFGVNLGVPGECYLVGLGETPDVVDSAGNLVSGQSERWDVKSIKELIVKLDKWHLVADDKEAAALDPESTFVARLWQRHPFRSEQADSLMRGILEPCDELMILSRHIRSVGTSRIAMNGLTLLSDQLSFGPPDPTVNDQADPNRDLFMEKLLEAATTAIQNEGSAAAAVPVFLRFPGQLDVEKLMKHFDFERKIDPQAPGLRKECLERIARGLPLPPEVVFGHQQTTYANAFQVNEDVFTKHIEPFVITLVQSLTAGFLWPQLEEQFGADARRVMVWYDPTDLVSKPDQGPDANEVADRNGLSGEALRRLHGIAETDAPSVEELLLRLVLGKGQLDPAVTGQILQRLGLLDAAPTAIPGVGPTEPAEQPAPAAIAAAAPPVRPSSDLGRRLIRLDQDLRRRLQVAADHALRQAFRKAGATLRSKAKRDVQLTASIDQLDNALVAAQIGPGVVAALGVADDQVLAEAFDMLAGQFDRWVAAAQATALDLVVGAAAVEVDDAALAAIVLRQADDRAEAWALFASALTNLAGQRLYDPSPAAPPVGEFELDTLVPNGMVRAAVARAGGNGAVTPDGLSTDGHPAGGIGGGPTVGEVVGQAGFAVEGYEWEYGVAPRARPFENHQRLDGYRFTDFTDPGLEIPWPGPWAIPGDHVGCLCDVLPILIETAEMVA